jgi:hypothetical protein
MCPGLIEIVSSYIKNHSMYGWKNSMTLIISYIVGFEVFTAVSMKNSVFWVVALFSLVDVNQRFRGHTASIIRAMKRWLTSTRLHSATTQKTEFFILIALMMEAV